MTLSNHSLETLYLISELANGIMTKEYNGLWVTARKKKDPKSKENSRIMTNQQRYPRLSLIQKYKKKQEALLVDKSYMSPFFFHGISISKGANDLKKRQVGPTNSRSNVSLMKRKMANKKWFFSIISGSRR